MNPRPTLAAWALVLAFFAAGTVYAQGAQTDANLASRIERPMLPLPSTVFWRYALLTPQSRVVAAEAAALAAAAKLAGNAASEARWITARANALHELPGADDASLNRAWQLASSAGDLRAAADAHLQLGLRAYRAGDPLAAGTHADGALRAAQEARDGGRVLAALALQRLIEVPLAGDTSLLGGGLFSSVQMRQLVQSMMGFMSRGREAGSASQTPLRERLLSKQVSAPGAALAVPGLPDAAAAWLGLIDGYQAYAEDDLALAEELWRAQTQPSTGATDERVRGLAWLGIAWLNMSSWSAHRNDREGRDEKAKPDQAEQQRAADAQAERVVRARGALQQARAAFDRAGVRSGAGQALLMLSELGYITGHVDEARVAVEQAGRIYADLGHEEVVLVARLLAAQGESQVGQHAAAAREVEAGEALFARSMSLAERVPAAVVTGLAEHARAFAAAAGRGTVRMPEKEVAAARGFLRWARGTGEPIVQLLALDQLSKVLAAAGYPEDAVFYRMIQARSHATYQAALPLESRLRRAALLDYDLLVLDGGANLAGELKLSSFERIEKAMIAVLETQRVMALDPRMAETVGLSAAEIERLAQAQRTHVERLLKEQRNAAGAFNAALSGSDRRAAARQFVELMRRVGDVRDAMESDHILGRTLEQTFTQTRNGQGAAPSEVKGRVVARYQAVLPALSAAETLHRTAFEAYERDVMVAGLVADPQSALKAASELAGFYVLYRSAVKPGPSADFPTTLELGRRNAGDSSRRTVPVDDKAREQLLDKGIGAYNTAYIDQLVQRIIGAEPDVMTGMGLIADDGAQFVRKNFDGQRGLKVLRNEVREVGLDGEGRRKFEVDHEYTHRLAVRANAEIVTRPEPDRSPDLAERLERLAKGSSPSRDAAPLNWGELVSGLATMNVLGTYSQQLLGVSLAASQERTSVFAALLTPAVIALSRSRTDDLTLPAGMLDFAAASAAVRRHPKLAALYLSLGATVGSITEDDLVSDPGSLGKALNGLLGGLSGVVADSEGPALDMMRTYLEGGIAQLIAYPELGLVLTGDEKGAGEFFARQQAARARAATLPKAAAAAGGSGADSNEQTPQQFESGFAVVLHHLLQGQWGDAVRELDVLRGVAGDHMPVVQYQLAYISAICHGRLQDAVRQDADLTASRDALDRVRAALRSRELARPLGLVRRAIYEHQLALLYARKNFAAMEMTLGRYKVATVTPVAAVRAAGEVATALGEARYHFDSVSRMTRTKQAQLGAVSPLVQSLANEESASDDPGRLALGALDRAAQVLLAEAGSLDTSPPTPKPPVPGGMNLSYFVGTKTSFVVAHLHGASPIGYRINAGAEEIERRALQFRRDISGRRDITVSADSLYRMLIAPVDNLGRAQQLLIWPDGVLGLLPFQALRRGAAGPYLVESAVIAYVTGTAAPTPATQLPAGATDLLVLGNPDGSLDSAESEAREIAGLELIKAREPLIRGAASPSNLARRLLTARAVHFATHGVFSEAQPNFSYLVLAEGQRLYSLDLGGLDFSAREIYLSACETRLGVPVPGDDVYGLADAFLSAGASSVVATLWRIESDASALFARRYYEQKSDVVSGSQSLALTAREFISKQRWLMQDGRTVLLDHPFYWAAYGMLSPAMVQH